MLVLFLPIFVSETKTNFGHSLERGKSLLPLSPHLVFFLPNPEKKSEVILAFLLMRFNIFIQKHFSFVKTQILIFITNYLLGNYLLSFGNGDVKSTFYCCCFCDFHCWLWASNCLTVFFCSHSIYVTYGNGFNYFSRYMNKEFF